MPPQKKPKKTDGVSDQKGWRLGVTAALKGVFGTNTEINVRHGNTREVFKDAQDAVDRMANEAMHLIEATEQDSPIDKIEDALQDLIRDL